METRSHEHEESSHLAAQHSDGSIEQAIPVYRQKFVWMIVLSMIIAVGFTAVSLRLYSRSSAAQLDLSRPGFEQVRAELDQTAVKTFEGTGAITIETVTEFQELYNIQHAKTETGQYASDTLSDEALGMTTRPESD